MKLTSKNQVFHTNSIQEEILRGKKNSSILAMNWRGEYLRIKLRIHNTYMNKCIILY